MFVAAYFKTWQLTFQNERSWLWVVLSKSKSLFEHLKTPAMVIPVPTHMKFRQMESQNE
jgi:hypothetical protein